MNLTANDVRRISKETQYVVGVEEAMIRDRFPNADNIILCDPQDFKAHLSLNSPMVAVVMTHKYLHDLALLPILLSSPLNYIGILGPKTRTQKLLQDLQTSGFIPTEEQLGCLYGPVGFDIGSETPEEIALSIVAEIQALLNQNMNQAIASSLRACSARSATDPYLR